MKKLDWLRTHPWIGTAFFAGLLTGILFCLPLVPYQLPDSTATLIGSAVGAALAVLGATWVAQGREDRARRLALARIHEQFSKVRAAFEPLAEQVKISGGFNFVGLQAPTIWFTQSVLVTAGRIDKMEGLFHSLGASGYAGYSDAVTAVTELKPFARELQDIAANPDQFSGADDWFRNSAATVEKLLKIFSAIEGRL